MEDINKYITENFPLCQIKMGKPESGWDVDNWCHYKTLTSGGIKKEGEEYPPEAFLPTAKKAWDCYLIELSKWLNQYPEGAMIYWRQMPEVIKRDMYAIKSRLDIAVLPNDYMPGEMGEGWK